MMSGFVWRDFTRCETSKCQIVNHSVVVVLLVIIDIVVDVVDVVIVIVVIVVFVIAVIVKSRLTNVIAPGPRGTKGDLLLGSFNSFLTL